MSDPDPYQRLRKLVPFMVAVIFFQVGCFAFVLFAKDKPRLWPMIACDLGLTVVVFCVLWRVLGRKR